MKLTDALLERIALANPLQRRFLSESLAGLRDDEAHALEAYLSYRLGRGASLDQLSQAYLLLVNDTMTEQIYFQGHDRYRYSTFAEVREFVYFNADYMVKYMDGLAITAFLWPNHRQMMRFFVDLLPNKPRGTYLEIGPGHGFYFMEAMRRTQHARFLGVDISPSSVAMTQEIIASGHFGHFSNYEIIEGDFLSFFREERYDSIVMGEVLEHVEEPRAFLEKIAALAHSESFVYVTTCANAPAVDHIHLFRSAEEVTDLVRSCGLEVVDQLLVPYTGRTIDESVAKKLPVNLALVLGRQNG